MNIVYTYFSDGIRNLDCGFCEIALFLECAKKSLRSALKQEGVDKVLIYTDDFGEKFLSDKIDFGYVFNGIEDKKDAGRGSLTRRLALHQAFSFSQFNTTSW